MYFWQYTVREKIGAFTGELVLCEVTATEANRHRLEQEQTGRQTDGRTDAHTHTHTHTHIHTRKDTHTHTRARAHTLSYQICI